MNIEKFELKRLSDIAKIRSSKRVLESDYVDDGIPFFRGSEIVRLNQGKKIKNSHFIKKELFEDLKASSGTPKIGDILVTANGTVGVSYVIDFNYDFYFKDAIIWIKSNNKFNSKYIHYIYESDYIYEQIIQNSKGTTILNYNLSQARKNTIPFPKLDIQNKIVSFLDENCSKIDNEVSLLQKKSILLDEYKNALIYETVTKGLDKNAEMRDSGVEWIGESVANWPVKRLKDIYVYKNGYAFSDEDYCDDSESYLVKITNIGSEHNFKNMQNLKINELTKKFEIKNNSILYALSGSVGKCSFYNAIENKSCYLNQRVAELTIKNGNVKYFYYVMSNNSFKNEIFGMIQGNVIKNLNKGHLDNSFTPVPNIETQNEIVKYLDNETCKIEKQIELINKKVELLKEYKQSLIYEAVTGQLDIE